MDSSSSNAKRKLFSAIVPCKDELEMLPIFYGAICAAMKDLPIDFEVIFVEDGSTDGTLEKLRKMSAEDSRVRYVSFSRNFGKEAAMYAGLKEARGDYIAIMDADLQDPPELLPEMFEAIQNGDFDCIATRRKNRAGEPALRSLGARYFYKLLNAVSNIKFTEGARDFRLMKRRVCDAILELKESNRFTKGFYEWVGFKTKWIEFENRERRAGTTKWSMWGLIKYSLDAITSFSIVPLAAVALIGLIMSLLSFCAIIFVVVRQLVYQNSAFGWTSMICVILFLASLQMFSLGMIGYYTAKVYLESKRRPIYVISESSSN